MPCSIPSTESTSPVTVRQSCRALGGFYRASFCLFGMTLSFTSADRQPRRPGASRRSRLHCDTRKEAERPPPRCCAQEPLATSPPQPPTRWRRFQPWPRLVMLGKILNITGTDLSASPRIACRAASMVRVQSQHVVLPGDTLRCRRRLLIRFIATSKGRTMGDGSRSHESTRARWFDSAQYRFSPPEAWTSAWAVSPHSPASRPPSRRCVD